jgi:tRNA (guanine37-N1)-methyltransferase
MALTVRRSFHAFRLVAASWKITHQRAPEDIMDPVLPLEVLPPINRAMRQLDRSFFNKTIPISAATIFDPKEISSVRSALAASGEVWSIFGPIKPVREDPEELGKKCILLNPPVKATDQATWSPTLRSLEDEGKIKVRPYDLTLTYDDWGMKMILDAILPELPPEETETPAGFSQVGHVAHLNLRHQYLPWKHIIGQIVLDKNKALTTVINKVDDVGAGAENEFRTFPYEVLAGPNNLDVTVHESDCEFKFNFGKVYWNPRLHTEHMRVISKFQPGEAVCDVMAGVGPFAVPAGKRKVFVWANDLNPNSCAALFRAIKTNKVEDYVSSHCIDGRKFIQWATAKLLMQQRVAIEKVKQKGKPAVHIKHSEPKTFDHYVMNLPRTAVEFLDSFRGIYRGRESLFQSVATNQPAPRKLPRIHVWLFVDRRGPGALQTEEEEIEVCRVISQHLGREITRTTPEVELVFARLVSPNRKYYRASFRLPPEVAFAESRPLNLLYVATGKDVSLEETDEEHLEIRLVRPK